MQTMARDVRPGCGAKRVAQRIGILLSFCSGPVRLAAAGNSASSRVCTARRKVAQPARPPPPPHNHPLSLCSASQTFFGLLISSQSGATTYS